MDESIKIPYYFPPQRYIPRLGGMGGSRGGAGPQSGAAGGFEGLSDTLKMLLQLKESKELKQEREKDKRDAADVRHKEWSERDEDRDQRAAFQQQNREAAFEDRGERRDEAGASRLERGGVYLMPGSQQAARQRGVASQPISPGAQDLTTPEGQNAFAGGALTGAQRGQTNLNREATAAAVTADKPGQTDAVPIGPQGEYGFARKPPQDERNSVYGRAQADRLEETRLTVALRAHDNWARRASDYVDKSLQRTFPTPYAELPPDQQVEWDRVASTLRKQYGKMDPEPTIPGQLPLTQPREPQAPQDPARDMIRQWFQSKLKQQGARP